MVKKFALMACFAIVCFAARAQQLILAYPLDIKNGTSYSNVLEALVGHHFNHFYTYKDSTKKNNGIPTAVITKKDSCWKQQGLYLEDDMTYKAAEYTYMWICPKISETQPASFTLLFCGGKIGGLYIGYSNRYEYKRILSILTKKYGNPTIAARPDCSRDCLNTWTGDNNFEINLSDKNPQGAFGAFLTYKDLNILLTAAGNSIPSNGNEL